MKKAKTQVEVFNTFNPAKWLTKENKEFYVNLFDRDLKNISDNFMWTENDQETMFIAGQSGNGKTSALKLLPHLHSDLLDKYDITYLDGRDKFDPNAKVDAVDVLLMIGFLFANKHDNLKNKYIDYIKKLQSEKLEEYKKIEESISLETRGEITSTDTAFKINLGLLKVGASFEDEYKLDKQTREVTRVLLKSKKRDFIDITNKIIREYTQNIDGKIALLIIDDIEKLKNSDDIYRDDIGTILQLECSKIITMPIHLKRKHTFAGQDVKEFGIKLKEKRDQKCIDKNIELLKEVVTRRLDNPSKLLDLDKALNRLVLASGGNLRQLIGLVKKSALNAGRDGKILLSDVENSIYELKKQFSSASQAMEKFLKEIEKNHKPIDYSEDSLKNLAIATQEQMIFAYHNSESWYDVNPILLDRNPCVI
jgi:energy-coupling factor transporter ATP-binding protein EcfA2